MGALLLVIGIILLLIGGYQLIALGSQYPPFATPARILEQVEGQMNLWRVVALSGLISTAVGILMLLRRRT